MRKPSKNYVVYDALTFEKKGFIEYVGKVKSLGKKPKYWAINVSVTTTNEDGSPPQIDRSAFETPIPLLLSDLSEFIADVVRGEEGYKAVCTSIIVRARIML